ncbi:MAG TPA: hypothetical protein VMG59_02385 [Phycisphaerae bacterium]|nr:hypothetical protein [Phycisphaerae bacterium]
MQEFDFASVQQRQSLEALIAMSESDFVQVVDCAQKTLLSDLKNVPTTISSALPAPIQAVAAQIIGTAINIQMASTYIDVSIDELVKSNFVDSTPIAPETQNKIDIALHRMNAILKTKCLALAIKSHEILVAHKNVYSNARVFTDMRAIFADPTEQGATPPAAGAVLVQMLRIRYVKNGETDDIYFALDTKDVKNLIVVLQRAIAKADTLRSVMSKISMPCVEVAEER